MGRRLTQHRSALFVYFIISAPEDTGGELQSVNEKRQIADYSFSGNVAEARINMLSSELQLGW